MGKVGAWSGVRMRLAQRVEKLAGVVGSSIAELVDDTVVDLVFGGWHSRRAAVGMVLHALTTESRFQVMLGAQGPRIGGLQRQVRRESGRRLDARPPYTVSLRSYPQNPRLT